VKNWCGIGAESVLKNRKIIENKGDIDKNEIRH